MQTIVTTDQWFPWGRGRCGWKGLTMGHEETSGNDGYIFAILMVVY